MSGLEIAGVLLATFPLIVSSLEHWRNAAQIGGMFWRIRKEYQKCRTDVLYHEILYQRSLKELLLPLINDPDRVAALVADPDGTEWSSKDLQDRLQERLQESYEVYIEIIREMNKIAGELRDELSLDKTTVQGHLALQSATKKLQVLEKSRLTSAKSRFDYEKFRLKFSLNEPVRNKLFERLQDYNGRLEKLLSSSDKATALQNATLPSHKKQCSVLEKAFKKARMKSDLLFKALHNAWQCSCQQYHFAHLRLEHRTLQEIYFEIILAFIAPPSQAITPWAWRELKCEQGVGCSSPHKVVADSTASQLPSSSLITAKKAALAKAVPTKAVPTKATPTKAVPTKALSTKALSTKALSTKAVPTKAAPTIPKIRFDLPIGPSVELCHLLSGEENSECLGIIGCDEETYHLHPFTKRKCPDEINLVTLDLILSKSFDTPLPRRQRYNIALLLASSVAQLQFTPWLSTALTKEDVFFFLCEDDKSNIEYQEPFIRQRFLPDDSLALEAEAYKGNFYSLGILLLELCFGRRLEDYPYRKRLPAEAGEAKVGLDLTAALTWLRSVADEGGDEYDSAVKWCFTGANESHRSWQGEIIKNVVRPLETCQQHFNLAN